MDLWPYYLVAQFLGQVSVIEFKNIVNKILIDVNVVKSKLEIKFLFKC